MGIIDTGARSGKIRQLGLLVPLIAFLLLGFLALRKGLPSQWHDQCVEFGRQGSWNRMVALGDNLNRIGKQDTETLFWAAFASNQLEDRSKTEYFAVLLLKQRHLNRAIESETRRLFRATTWRQWVAQYRTTITYWVLLPNLLLLSATIASRRNLVPWISVFSAFGCLILLL